VKRINHDVGGLSLLPISDRHDINIACAYQLRLTEKFDENASDFFTSLINNFQQGVCLRNKKTNDVRCRYYFPTPIT